MNLENVIEPSYFLVILKKILEFNNVFELNTVLHYYHSLVKHVRCI